MGECNLVICDSSIQYAKCFAENVKAHKELTVKVYVCTDIENVRKFLEKKQIHLLVIDEKYPYAERIQLGARYTFVLGEGKISNLGEKEKGVFKYQNFDQIIREILECYVENGGESLFRVLGRERPKLISVYSPASGNEKSRFALALGKEYAKKRPTLYLNLEEYPSFHEAFEEGMNVGDFLYYIKQENRNLGFKLQCAVKKMQNLDFLLPIPIVWDLKSISLSEWELLLEKIMENSVYECVILDVGESVQGLFQLLEGCDLIYMPVQNDEYSERKLKWFERNLEYLNLERLRNITQKIFLPENVEEYAKMRAKEEF